MRARDACVPTPGPHPVPPDNDRKHPKAKQKSKQIQTKRGRGSASGAGVGRRAPPAPGAGLGVGLTRRHHLYYPLTTHARTCVCLLQCVSQQALSWLLRLCVPGCSPVVGGAERETTDLK